MTEKTYRTTNGPIRYFISDRVEEDAVSLIFLHGLTADHRMFEKQAEYFEGKYNVLVWDAPGQGASWPFDLRFTLEDEAVWLEEILQKEGLLKPIVIGQSMGGYTGQTYAQLYPRRLKGFVSIDSAPLQRHYFSRRELWMLNHAGLLYRFIPWHMLLKSGPKRVSVTSYGQKRMLDMMRVYDGDHKRFLDVSSHGSRMIVEGVKRGLPYEIRCPALLICGEEDLAGPGMRFNKAWHRESGIPLEIIANAGHNANMDAPEKVNALIEALAEKL